LDEGMKDYTIFETSHFTASQASGYRVPGYVIVQSKAQCMRLADFSPVQAADLTKCLADAEALVQKIVQPERIYILKFGEENPQVHFHIFPRTARIAQAYVEQVRDDPPYSGARIVDWVWHNHESLGFTDEQIQNFVDETRRIIQQDASSLRR
jgi:diadenosine tetraphosphate (Ap4A) HIT family hydrolase